MQGHRRGATTKQMVHRRLQGLVTYFLGGVLRRWPPTSLQSRRNASDQLSRLQPRRLDDRGGLSALRTALARRSVAGRHAADAGPGADAVERDTIGDAP